MQVPLMPGLRWTVSCGEGMKVVTAQLRHRVPCWGYVFKEPATPPKEIPERLLSLGMKPGDAAALLREGTRPSSQVTTPSGQVVPLQALFNPPVQGRKVVLLGDTCDSGAIEGLFALNLFSKSSFLSFQHLCQMLRKIVECAYSIRSQESKQSQGCSRHVDLTGSHRTSFVGFFPFTLPKVELSDILSAASMWIFHLPKLPDMMAGARH